MVDAKQLGRMAGQVLDNDAFRHVCGEVQTDMRKAFMGDDDAKAMEARREAKALEAILSKLTRLRERGSVIEKQEKEARNKRDREEAQVAS